MGTKGNLQIKGGIQQCKYEVYVMGVHGDLHNINSIFVQQIALSIEKYQIKIAAT